MKDFLVSGQPFSQHRAVLEPPPPSVSGRGATWHQTGCQWFTQMGMHSERASASESDRLWGLCWAPPSQLCSLGH